MVLLSSEFLMGWSVFFWQWSLLFQQQNMAFREERMESEELGFIESDTWSMSVGV